MNKGLEAARKAPRKKRPSMRKAIDAKCKECIYDPLSGLGTWRQQTHACPSTDCPLHELRPLSESPFVPKEDVDGDYDSDSCEE